jgi:VIT1/CCC1 family predicted Fe2+/Mn2+ transporter
MRALPMHIRLIRLPGILDPVERISEVLFGVIMALTFTCALAIATADQAAVRTMLISALGCNFVWGIVDAGIYLIGRLHEKGRKVLLMRALREAKDAGTMRRIVEDAMPLSLASMLTDDQLAKVREARALPAPSAAQLLGKRDFTGALGVFLLCFLSTLPIALPFILFGQARTALRVSNGVAIAMLALCGYVLGQRSGIHPLATASAMVAFGVAMVALAIKLGG